MKRPEHGASGLMLSQSVDTELLQLEEKKEYWRSGQNGPLHPPTRAAALTSRRRAGLKFSCSPAERVQVVHEGAARSHREVAGNASCLCPLKSRKTYGTARRELASPGGGDAELRI